jgi:hypothetical protein
MYRSDPRRSLKGARATITQCASQSYQTSLGSA